jgi:hypothetical protein
MMTIWLSGYPYRGIPCTTGAALISFIVALKTIKSTGMALMMRPAQTIFFVVGAAVAADGLIAGFCVTELMNFPPRRVTDEDFSGGRSIAGVLHGTER